MLKFNDIRNYIESNEFHLDLFDNRIHVINYEKILSLGDEKIILFASNKKIILSGKKFSLSKMCDDELLIEGIFCKVEIER